MLAVHSLASKLATVNGLAALANTGFSRGSALRASLLSAVFACDNQLRHSVLIRCFCQCNMKPLRWGIVSAGNISHDFTNALATLPKEDHQVVAISARKLADASKFAKLHGIGKFYEGYESLAKDADVGKLMCCSFCLSS